MASILDVSVSSDSEDDADYIPTGEVVPSESSGEEEDDELEDPKPKRLKANKSVKRNKGVKEREVMILKEDLNNDPKKHADDIWKSFLSDVEATSKAKPSTVTSAKPSTVTSAKPSTVTSADVLDEVRSSSIPIPVESSSNVLKEPTASVFEFAGETFTADNGFSPSSSLEKTKISEGATAPEVKATEGLSKKRGIGSVLGTLFNKKQKVTTLQKTLFDWQSFKKDEGIEEDLEKFNKGRGGFIERQRFLQRSDVRSFEVEKNIRQSKKKK